MTPSSRLIRIKPNLEADPYELNDLSQEPEHQAKLKDFQNEVFQWWEETSGAPIPERIKD